MLDICSGFEKKKMKNVQTTSELNKRGMIRNSDCFHVSTGWFSPNVRGLSPWGQYAGFTLSLGVSHKERVRMAGEETFMSKIRSWQL